VVDTAHWTAPPRRIGHFDVDQTKMATQNGTIGARSFQAHNSGMSHPKVTQQFHNEILIYSKVNFKI